MLLAARSGGIEEPEPFLQFDADSVDSLSVSNSDGSVSLAKVDGAWQLPGGVPAAEFKVDSVLGRFADAAGSWPVANTASTRERFEVTEDNHQRHIVVKAGEDVLADIYLGTSPGYRKTHARRAGEDEIYAVRFSNYEAGVKTADWLDRSLLRPKGDVTALRRLPGGFVPSEASPDPESEEDSEAEAAPAEPVAAFELGKDEEGGWVSADGTELDQAKTETFAGRFTGLSVTGVSEATLPESATMTFAIADDDGEQTLAVYALEDGETYVAVSDRVAGAYELSKFIAEQMNKPLSDLVPDPPEDPDAEADASAGIAETTEEEASADAEAPEPAAAEEADATEESETAPADG